MARTEAPAVGDRCPRCGGSLISERQAVAWCGGCQWNLSLHEPARHRPELGWRWVDRSTRRAAYRLTVRQFEALSGGEVERPGWGPARVAMVTAGVVFLLAIVAVLLAGGYLTVRYWPEPLAFIGVALMLLAVGLRPRLGRLGKYAQRLREEQVPALFGLVGQVAVAVGTRRPDVIVVDERFNASCTTIGLRRRRVLRLGLPLWAVLTPQQRVALLAHELGHFVNGDLRRGVLTGIPINTLMIPADVSRPERRRPARQGGIIAAAEMITGLLMALVHRLLWGALVLTLWVWLRDGQRAEYRADQIAARVAGSRAVVDLFLVTAAVTTSVVVVARRTSEVKQWRAAADQARLAMRDRITALRQLAVRDQSSLFASHPPDGLRARMVESRPPTTPEMTLTESESDRVDQELTKWYERTRRDLQV